MKSDEGIARVRPLKEALEAQGVQLRKKGGERSELGLRTADLVMDGYLS
jgi:hypothetical protein